MFSPFLSVAFVLWLILVPLVVACVVCDLDNSLTFGSSGV